MVNIQPKSSSMKNTETNLSFSVIIPTYKRGPQLCSCLDAIQEQLNTFPLLEIVIVNDGGNKEGLIDLPQKYQKLPLLIQHLSKNEGPAFARNVGIKISKGDIIVFLDDDSVPTATWGANLKCAWEMRPDVDGIGGYAEIDEAETIYCQLNAKFFNWFLKWNETEHSSCFINTFNSSFKRLALIEWGGFDESFRDPAGEDRELCIRAFKSHSKLSLDENLLVYHEKGLDFRGFLKKHYMYGQASAAIYRKHLDYKGLPKRAFFSLFYLFLGNHESWLSKVKVITLIILAQVVTLLGRCCQSKNMV
jgi:glycosyltransferase involved in cell wall biosynthesis